jgi:hypothetical protein
LSGTEFVTAMVYLGEQTQGRRHSRPNLPCAFALAGYVLFSVAARGQAFSAAANLPDAPSAVLLAANESSSAVPAEMDPQKAQATVQPITTPNTPPKAMVHDCPTGFMGTLWKLPTKENRQTCVAQNPLQFVVEPGPFKPLTPSQKGHLAIKEILDPFSLSLIVVVSGISVAADSHSVYGPGFAGWGRQIGYSFAEDVQGTTTGTYILPVIFHEDPRYHRLPGHPVPQRLLHAIGHTFISQHDDGSIMPNYATLINYPLSDEIGDLYVPGVSRNLKSTAENVALGYATDPVGAIVSEFLPDVARRIHFHVIFAQQYLNRIAQQQ